MQNPIITNIYNNSTFPICISNECNFRCSYCFEQHMENKYNDNTINDETIQKISGFIRLHKFLTGTDIMIYILGGEPLLHLDRAKKIIEETKDIKDITYTIVSNIFLADKLIDELLELKNIVESHGNKFLIRASIDFYLHDSQRVQGTYKKVWDNAKLLMKSGIRLITNTVVNIENMKYIDKVYDEYEKFIRELDEESKENFAHPMFNINCIDVEKEMDYDIIPQLNYLYKKNMTNRGIHPILFGAYNKMKVFDKFNNNLYYNIFFDVNGDCYFYTWYKFQKYYDKYVNFKEKDYTLGNVNKNTYKEIFEKYKDGLEDFKKDQDIDECRRCVAEELCKTNPWVKNNQNYCKALKFIYKYVVLE